jgi:hypothetical protein
VKKWWRVGAVVAVGAAAAIVVAGTSSATTTSSGWKTVYYVPTPTNGGGEQVSGLVATSSTAAWATGESLATATLNGSDYSPFYRWKGTSWQPTATSGTLHGYEFSPIASSSASNALALGYQLSGELSHYDVTAHWNGTSWTIYHVAPPTADALVTFSATDAWAAGNGHVYQWNGKSWRTYTVAGDISQLIGFGTNNIWGIGSTTSQGSAEIVRWNGSTWKTWQTLAAAPKGDTTGFTSVAEDTSKNVWLAGSASNSASYVYHWNGSTLSKVALPSGVASGLRSIANDGRGGFWGTRWTVSAVGGGSVSSVEFVHYSGGRWTSAGLPGISGIRGSGVPEVIENIPGTTSMWAIVDYVANSDGASRSVIIRYTS